MKRNHIIPLVYVCVCNVKTKRNYKWLTICLVCLCASVHDSIASERMSYVQTTALTAVNETAARRRAPRAGRTTPFSRARPPRRPGRHNRCRTCHTNHAISGFEGPRDFACGGVISQGTV
jgi:hypothetical protein